MHIYRNVAIPPVQFHLSAQHILNEEYSETCKVTAHSDIAASKSGSSKA